MDWHSRHDRDNTLCQAMRPVFTICLGTYNADQDNENRNVACIVKMLSDKYCFVAV